MGTDFIPYTKPVPKTKDLVNEADELTQKQKKGETTLTEDQKKEKAPEEEEKRPS